MYEHTNRCDIFQSAYIFSILLNENEVPHIGHGRPELVLRSDGLLARGHRLLALLPRSIVDVDGLREVDGRLAYPPVGEEVLSPREVLALGQFAVVAEVGQEGPVVGAGAATTVEPISESKSQIIMLFPCF